MEEVATPHSGEAPGEMGLEQVGSRLVHNFSDMNESCDSRSSSLIAPVRSIPLRTKSKSRLRNGRTLLQRPDRIASPYLRTKFDCAERVIPVWIPASGTQFAVRYLLRKDKPQSTAFLVAQIFSIFLLKVRGNGHRRRKLQKIERWNVSCF